jgi:hypothetical protein
VGCGHWAESGGGVGDHGDGDILRWNVGRWDGWN